MKPVRLLSLLLPLLAAAGAAQAAPEYTVAALGQGGFAGLNNLGAVVGTISGAHGQARAFTVDADGADVLNLVRSPTWGRALNDAGQMAVAAAGEAGPATRPWIVTGNTITQIGSLGYGGFTTIDALNDAGQATGASGHAYLYGPRQGMLDLGTLGGQYSWGRDLNGAGSVVGGATFDDSGRVAAFIYSGGSMRALGTLGGRDSEALAINDSSVAVGWASSADSHLVHRAVLYANGAVTDLGALDGDSFSIARDINEAGEIVGASGPAGQGRAFLYRDGAMVDLNALLDPQGGVTLTDASAINDRHQILATGRDAAGVTQYFLLTPVSPVPEPSMLASLVAGLALLGGRRCRQLPRHAAGRG